MIGHVLLFLYVMETSKALQVVPRTLSEEIRNSLPADLLKMFSLNEKLSFPVLSHQDLETVVTTV